MVHAYKSATGLEGHVFVSNGSSPDHLVSNRIDLCGVWSTAQRWSPLIVASRRDYARRWPSSCVRIPRAGPTSVAAADRSG